MRKLLLILLLFGCHEKEVTKFCFDMTISDAAPIKMWLNGQENYNQKLVPNIQHKCFIQEFKCADEVRFQFTNADPDKTFTLKVYSDIDGATELASIAFDKSISIDSLALGENTPTGSFLINWTISDNPHTSPNTAGIPASKVYRDAIRGAQTLTDYVFRIALNRVGTGSQSGSIRVAICDAAMTQLQYWDYAFSGGASVDINDDLDYIGGSGLPAYITVDIQLTGGSGIETLTINELSIINNPVGIYVYSLMITGNTYSLCNKNVYFKIIDDSDSSVWAFSDAVKFSDRIAPNTLIKYKSGQNFAGLIYDESTDYFWLRIPGRFYHRREPGEQRSINLSNKTSSLGANFKKQTLLEIQDCPYFMIEKIKLALMHGVSGLLIIADEDGEEVYWLAEESMEFQNEDLRSPFRGVQTWLTKKNSFTQNLM